MSHMLNLKYSQVSWVIWYRTCETWGLFLLLIRSAPSIAAAICGTAWPSAPLDAGVLLRAQRLAPHGTPRPVSGQESDPPAADLNVHRLDNARGRLQPLPRLRVVVGECPIPSLGGREPLVLLP